MSQNLELYILTSLALGIGEDEVLILELLVSLKIRAKSVEIIHMIFLLRGDVSVIGTLYCSLKLDILS